MKFRTYVEPLEPMRGLEIPPEVVEALGGGKRPAVTITINGHSWKSRVAIMRGRYLLGLSTANRLYRGYAGPHRAGWARNVFARGAGRQPALVTECHPDPWPDFARIAPITRSGGEHSGGCASTPLTQFCDEERLRLARGSCRHDGQCSLARHVRRAGFGRTSSAGPRTGRFGRPALVTRNARCWVR
jgi:hypothetical protein